MHAIIAFLLLLVFGAPFLWTFSRSGSGVLPLLYSQILLGGVVMLLLVVMIEELRVAHRARLAGQHRETPIHRVEVSGYLVTCAYVWSWTLIGHVAATAAFLVAVLILAGERRPFVVLAYAVILPALIQFFFVWLLRIPLPAARWNVFAL